ERLAKTWTRPIYTFFDPTPEVKYEKTRRYHAFRCNARFCKGKSRIVNRFLDSKDHNSTSNLRKHAKKCWGDEIINTADQAKDASEVRNKIMGGFLRDGSITTAFERKGKGEVLYSHRAHTWTQSRAEFIRWVSESLRPFKIVNNHGFHCLMKTGQPGTYIPSDCTVSRDVKAVFAKARQRIAKMLREYDGALNFATDAWTSPNHKAYIALTVHFEHNGAPISMILDIVEVAKVLSSSLFIFLTALAQYFFPLVSLWHQSCCHFC
ncbi:uncharacterized protein STEHIDRAFT_47451, partial [Stereum hirsutum FP-91666 SS1]|uniref:uncharacterized protein n=1 Tax=Stereum hirsutum (strain FP-91666) TaxID=721885 RepID=UPI000440BDC4